MVTRGPEKGLGSINGQERILKLSFKLLIVNSRRMILEGSSKFSTVNRVALEISMVSRGPRKDLGSINGQQRILKGFMKF